MVKGLRVVMYIYAAILLLSGLAFIFIPDQMASMYDVTAASGFAKFVLLMVGAIYLAAGVWIMVAAREPLRDINWVKFVITKGTLSIIVGIYAIIVGYVNLNPLLTIIILDAILMILLLAFYPWRAAHSSD
ncbi:hypothetical protein ACFLX3_04435 [Chloroflexota bacterium]